MNYNAPNSFMAESPDWVWVIPRLGESTSGGRGGERNRTAVRGFAGPCLTTRPRRRARYFRASEQDNRARGEEARGD